MDRYMDRCTAYRLTSHYSVLPVVDRERIHDYVMRRVHELGRKTITTIKIC